MRCLLLCALVSAAAFAGESPWPAPVEGHEAVEPGEHPRLFFRKSDLPALKARAKTEAGQAILKRLRVLLDGDDGEDLPSVKRDPDPPYGDKSKPIDQPEGCLSMSHAAGYGFLYQLTGEQKYADMGRQCFEWALEGFRDRDGKARYSMFRKPTGALRAGPTLGWAVVGYDLCYDGWDEDFRRKVCRAIENYDEGKHMSLEELVKGKRHFPASNHWGMQVGGGALALLAITGDPEVADQGRIDELLDASEKAMIRNVTEGFGDGGYFAEGDGTGSMASHIVYLSAIQAWKTAKGLDFVGPRPNVRWTALKWFLMTIPREDKLDNLVKCFPDRGGYPHNIWARDDGVSGAGYFSIGYEAVLPAQRAGIKWFYEQHLRDHDAANGHPWDTPSPYPHHAILAFVNTPFELESVNPAEVMPRNVRDTQHHFFAFRNRWQDRNDIVISQLARKSPHRFRHGPDRAMKIWYHGKREEWGSIPGQVDHWQPAADGSAIIGGDGTWIAIDFSGASGVDGMIVMAGSGAAGGDASASAGEHTYQFKFLVGEGQTAPTPSAEGAVVNVGEQTVSFAEGVLTLGTWAGPWQGPAEVEEVEAAAPAEEGGGEEAGADAAANPGAPGDAELIAKVEKALAAGKEPTFTFALSKKTFTVTGIDDQGRLQLRGEKITLPMALDRFSDEDKAALAAALE